MSNLRYFGDLNYGGHKGIEVMVDPTDNSLFLSSRTIENILQYEEDSVRKKFSSKKFLSFCSSIGIETTKKSQRIKDSAGRENVAVLYRKDACDALIAWEVARGGHIGIGLLPENVLVLVAKASAFLETGKERAKSPEREIQFRLSKELGGQVEVQTPGGEIDILTTTEIIEIKNVKGWKSAIGQILVYGHYYPSHRKKIILFGSCHTETKQMIESHCHRLGICVEWNK